MKDIVKSGWWKVAFNITLEGEEVRFSDLPKYTQEYIVKSILEGCREGEILETVEVEELKEDRFVTTEDFWDCECEHNYIHPSGEGTNECKICGVQRNTSPDSRVEEVKKAGLL